MAEQADAESDRVVFSVAQPLELPAASQALHRLVAEQLVCGRDVRLVVMLVVAELGGLPSATAERGCNNTVTTAIDGLDGFAKLDFRARATP